MPSRRFPMRLVPIAFLTLACANPFGSVAGEVAGPARGATQQTPAKAAPKAASRAKTYGREEPLPKKAGTIRLAAYNVENLFDDQDDPAISGDIDDKAMTTPPHRLAALADTIKRLDADILALEEIESRDALLAFRDGYLKDLGYDHVASLDAGDRRGIEQSVLSRFPIVEATNWPDERVDDMVAKREGQGWATPANGVWPTRWARSPLMVRVQAPDGYELTLFVVHHKAGREFDAQRELEGLQVLEFVRERLAKNPNENLAIVGDFNNTPSKRSVHVYGETERPRLRNAYEERFDRRAPADTYSTHASGRPIDYIFMSPGLAKDVVKQSFFVLGTPIAPTAEDPKPAGYASDHFPIAVDLISDVRRKESPKTDR